MVFFTTRFVKAGKAGCTYGLLVFIRPEYRNDRGLLEHERVHVRQWLRTLGLHSILYAVSKAYRLSAEIEACRRAD